MPKYPTVYVILLNWNNSEETLECLDSLAHVPYASMQVVVVDNGSEARSREALEQGLKRIKMPVVFLPNEKNLGFSGGNNVGIRYALLRKADFVMLLNNDTRVDPDFLQFLVDAAKAHPDGGFFSPRIYYYDKPGSIWFGGGKIAWLHVSRVGEHEEREEKKEPYETGFLSGCALFMRREALEQVGDMDERFFLYFEDIDMSIRAQKAGWKTMVVPSSRILHKVSHTTLPRLGSARLLYYHHRNGLLLAKKHASPLINLYKHFWALAKIGKQSMKYTMGNDKEIARAILKGIADYYQGTFGNMS